MASAIQPPRSYDNAKSGVKYNRTGASGINFEMVSWVLMRGTGIVLVVLIFGAMIPRRRGRRSGRTIS